MSAYRSISNPIARDDEYVTLHTEGGRDAVLENPWPGTPIAVPHTGQAAKTPRGQRLSLDTSTGEAIRLAPVKTSRGSDTQRGRQSSHPQEKKTSW